MVDGQRKRLPGGRVEEHPSLAAAVQRASEERVGDDLAVGQVVVPDVVTFEVEVRHVVVDVDLDLERRH